VYKTREARIRAEFGTVPAYAVATAGAPVDVAPSERRRRRDRLTTPADPSRGVSREEFDDMVRDLGVAQDSQGRPAAAGSRPRGGSGSGPGAGDEPKKPRNRRHGRPR
jgi:SecD/SecF fusion protein